MSLYGSQSQSPSSAELERQLAAIDQSQSREDILEHAAAAVRAEDERVLHEMGYKQELHRYMHTRMHTKECCATAQPLPVLTARLRM